MGAKLIIEAILPSKSGGEVAALLYGTGAPREGARVLTDLVTRIASGVEPGRLRVSVDTSTGVKATRTVTCVQASQTAGDRLIIGGIAFTGVAGAATAASAQYSIDTSDAAVATSLAAAINATPAARGRFTATPSSGTVIITAFEAGTAGNTLELRKSVTTAAAFSFTGTSLASGRDVGDRQSLTAALGGALSINDTVTIGSVVLTAVAVPANESEFVGAVSAAADGAALAACINAHSKLKGLFLASGTATVTIQLLIGGRLGAVIGITKSAAQITLSAASFAPTTTEAYAAGAGGLEYGLGAP